MSSPLICPFNKGQRHFHEDAAAVAGLRFDGQPAAQQRDPLLDPVESQVTIDRRPDRIEAPSVVLNDGADALVVLLQEDADGGGLGVSRHVGQRLLDDAVEGRLQRRA